jgi:restriction system protein
MMARRRRRSKDPLGEILSGVTVLIFLISYYYTNSFVAGALAFGVFGAIALGIALAVKLKCEERLMKSGIHDIDKMDGRQFEHYLGLLFKSQGYKVELTRAAGDYGADLVIQKDGKRIVVQAKRYSKNVGIEAVQQAQASIAHYKAHEAWVVSNRDYTDAARNLASSNSVRLINREMLIEMILKMNPAGKPDPKQVIAQMPQKQLTCDRCGNQMVLRKGPKGEFYGCSGYPKCRHIKAI